VIFPACSFSGHAKPGGKRFCRLSPQASLVTLLTCRSCPHAGTLSTSLEPITTSPLVDETAFPECVHLGPHLRSDTVKVGCCGMDSVEVWECLCYCECMAKWCSTC
jgi:hypothetical protein